MNTFILKKDPNEFEANLLTIINEAFEKSKPLNYFNNYLEKLSPTSIRIGKKIIKLSKGRLYVIGWGKVAGAMAEAVEEILGPELIEKGVIVTNNPNHNLKKIKIFKGTHPLPSRKNILAAKNILSLAGECSFNDHVICLVSGGGSSILCLPAKPISLKDKITLTKCLIQNGIEVEKTNRIRKHCSDIKGGKLAQAIYPAKLINFIISDDINDSIHSIGSGPTVPDPTTFRNAIEVIDNAKLRMKLPSTIIRYLDRNIDRQENETLKPNSERCPQILNNIVFNNYKFITNIKTIALSIYKNVYVYPGLLSGYYDNSIELLTDYIKSFNNQETFVVIAGGEVEIKYSSNGRGGRAQHFAAGMIPKISKYKKAAFAAIATDGNDYIEGIGGAIITNESMYNIKELNIPFDRYFQDFRSFNIHQSLGSHLITKKQTNTNVFDAFVFLNIGKL